jgi:uncharacterized membrane protein AbrB (regulator of aidB expression)
MWRIQLSNFRSQTGIIIVLLIWTVVYSVGLRWYYESYRPSKGSSPSNIDSNFTASTSISNNYVRDAYSKVSYARSVMLMFIVHLFTFFSALSARELLELKSGMKVDAYFKELLKNVSTPVHKFRPKGKERYLLTCTLICSERRRTLVLSSIITVSKYSLSTHHS